MQVVACNIGSASDPLIALVLLKEANAFGQTKACVVSNICISVRWGIYELVINIIYILEQPNHHF